MTAAQPREVAGVKAVLDHVAVGARTLTDGWDLFVGLLGGSWAYGGDSPGFWWGQLQFRSGPKIELITPTGGADAAFLERFLTARGAGPHHFNFIVPDISATLSRLAAVDVEPVQVRLDNPSWKEAFLRPKDAYGIVVQVAQQSGKPPDLAPPAQFPAAGVPSAFSLVEHRVGDMDGALRLFAEALEGDVVRRLDTAEGSVAELSWDNGAQLRLVQPALASGVAQTGRDDGLAYLRFSRVGDQFSPAERSRAADLAHRLGVSLQLGD